MLKNKIDIDPKIIKISLATITALTVIGGAIFGAYLYLNQKEGNDKETEPVNTIITIPENVAEDKKEEDLKKTEINKDAKPVKAPQDSLLEGKYLTPPPKE